MCIKKKYVPTSIYKMILWSEYLLLIETIYKKLFP